MGERATSEAGARTEAPRAPRRSARPRTRPRPVDLRGPIRFAGLMLVLGAAAFLVLRLATQWEQAAPAWEGPVTVLVVDAEGAPVPGALVRFHPDPEDRLTPLPPPPAMEGETDGEGMLAVRLGGPHHLAVWAPGFGTAAGFAEPGDREARVALAEPRIQEGVVEDRQGQPVAGASVAAIWGSRRGPHLEEATTDAEGRFRLVSLGGTLSHFLLRARAAGFALAELECTFGDAVRVRLAESPPCRGLVVDAAGQPVGDALVVVDGLPSLWARTGADGRFLLQHLGQRQGGHRLRVARDGLTHRPIEGILPGAHLEVRLVPPRSVEGVVLSGDPPRPLAEGMVFHQSGPRAPVEARTDGAGRFVLGDLPAAPVTLHVVPPGRGARVASFEVEVPPGPAAPLRLVLP